MGLASHHPPVVSLVVAFSGRTEALDWGRQQVEAAWGPVALTSPEFAFEETDYYTQEMGARLRLVIWALQRLISPEELVERKRQTNAWEQAYGLSATAAAGATDLPSRPLNLDPGYLTLAKLVLASTKDHAHRLYQGQGIYHEVTLNYVSGRWQALPWTYPNYRRDDYQAFLTECRDWYRGRLREERRT